MVSVSKQTDREGWISILNQKGGMLNIHGRYNPLVYCVHMRGESEDEIKKLPITMNEDEISLRLILTKIRTLEAQQI